jgi:hypothetical protein
MTTLSRWIAGTAAVLAASTTLVQADVTVQQKTTLDVASMVHVHGMNTTNWTADKKREDTETHCEGLMSMVCGNLQGGEIVRLDRDVTWHLQPSKKRFTEQAFATPEELAAMRARMQANIDKMNACPATQKKPQGVDKSKCEMSPPKIDVHKTDDKASFAGHEAQRTAATLTESCTNKETGDVCDTVVALDIWLTQDSLPGSADRQEFDKAYVRKLGLGDPKSFIQGAQAQQFLAAYQSQLKELAAKSGDLKGQSLKTSFRIVMGGPNCKSAARNQAGGAQDGSDAAGGANPVANVAQAGKAIGAQVGQLMGGLFKKKKADDSQVTPSGAGTDGASAGPKPADPYAQYVELASFSTETVTIDAAAVPAARFDIPPDWTKEQPKVSKGGDDEFTCPKS